MNKVWKVAPGRNAAIWPEVYDGKCTTINWLKQFDLSKFESVEAVKAKLLAKDEGKSGSARSIWQFVHEISIGDVVIANDGLSKVVGLGIVKSKYLPPGHHLNPNVLPTYHKHARRVDWRADLDLYVDKNVFNQPTVQRLKQEQIDKIKRACLKKHPELRELVEELFPSRLRDDEATDRKDDFIPNDKDERSSVERTIKARRGQKGFRDALRLRYSDRCLVTKCNVVALLEAAHINPYRGAKDNDPSNGLLLRADIHTLYDLNLLGIEPDSLKVVLSPTIASDKYYAQLNGKKLTIPGKAHPSVKALRKRFQQFQEAQS